MLISSTKKMGMVSAWLAGVALVGSWSAGCVSDPEPAAVEDPAEAAIKARIEALTAEMADLPGELVVTRSSGESLDEATRETLASAAKIIHVYSDGQVAGYRSQAREVPDAPVPRRDFFEVGGDIIVGPSEALPDYVIQREEELAAYGIGLTLLRSRTS